MNIITIMTFVGGLVLLIIGADALVRGASRFAAALGLSPLVIGLTVVAFGTSTPELAVSIRAGLAGQAGISLGNVVGSNIFNVLFILGLSASITPLIVSHQVVKTDVPIMIGVSILPLILGLDGLIGRGDGFLFLIGISLYLVLLFHQSRRSLGHPQRGTFEEDERNKRSTSHYFRDSLFIVGGLGMLILGSRWLVDGAVVLASILGVSQLIIGLTIVAVGTSLPEVATSLIAAIRGERDIAVGNIVGSNIFNILSVLGFSSVLAPDGIHVSDEALNFDIPVMIAVSIACLPIFFTGHIIERWEGLLFLGYYIVYTIYLILESTRHKMLPVFSSVMLLFVIPITILTLIVVAWRATRSVGER